MRINNLNINLNTLEMTVSFETTADLKRAADAMLNRNGSISKSEMDAEISKLVRENGIIDAIKYHREKTGAYLVDSKKYVENVRDGIPNNLFR